jgi:hypothetical protein
METLARGAHVHDVGNHTAMYLSHHLPLRAETNARFRYTGSMRTLQQTPVQLSEAPPWFGGGYGRLAVAGLLLLSAALLPATLPAKDKDVGPFPGQARSATVQLDTELVLDRTQVESIIGNSMDGYLVVVKVKLKPLREKEPVRVFRDDFVLVSAKDGQRSQPFAPEQLAGASTMVVSQVLISAGPVAGQQNGPVWGPPTGGAPGTMGGPRRIDSPGASGGSVGSPTAGATAVTQEIREDKVNDKQTAWLETLKTKVLAEGETKEPVEGLLYFPLNGKHKPKDMTLLYNGTWPKMEVSYDPKKR